jgi:hypothetical protein
MKIDVDYGKIPLYFIPNEGQVHEQGLFYAKTSGYTLWLTKNGLVFDKMISSGEQKRHDGVDKKPMPRSRKNAESPKYRHDVSRLTFHNANKDTKVVPAETDDYKVNYFIGNDRTKWRTGIPTSKAALYKELYKNIDLKIYGAEKEIEYDFNVKPGGMVSDIKFEYRDVKKTSLDEEGNLVVETDFGQLKHKKPSCYQIIEGEKIEVAGKFKEICKNTYSFEVKKQNDKYELIIDPVILVYSTYLGGADDDGGNGIAVDKKGAVYITGSTSSANFPLKKAMSGKRKGSMDVFLTKISPTGASLIYSTYLGGNSWETGMGIAVDDENAVYLTGYTDSKDFPTKNPFQKDRVWFTDAFIAKIKNDGSDLIYSTYLGGSGFDRGYGIAIDKAGAAYVTGETESYDFPTKNPIYKYKGGYWGDVFITKINNDGSDLIYSTYLGGSDNDCDPAIAVDAKGSAYVVGYTESKNFPIKNPFQGKKSSYSDAFVTKIHPSGTSLVYSTFLGGKGSDYGSGIAVDNKGAVYITGGTSSKDFPIKNAIYQIYKGGVLGGDSFITKIHPKGNSLVFSTYLGGTGDDIGFGIALDNDDNIYVSGRTKSVDFPVKDAFQNNLAGGEWGDVFIAKIKPNGKTMDYSSYLGGSDSDGPWDITADEKGAVYLIGWTRSTDFPTKKPIYKKNAGKSDVFITKLK